MRTIEIHEMAARDGLQFLPLGPRGERLPLEPRLEFIRALQACNFPYIEIGAFVSERVTPQMADTPAVCKQIQARPGQTLAALVPNLRHYERFRQSGLQTAALFVSASEAYAQRNWGADAETVLNWALEVAQAARADGVALRAHVSAAFQDIDDPRRESDTAAVVRLAQRLIAAGCNRVALADTAGDTHPHRVRAVIQAVSALVPMDRIGVHLHDRRGIGLANAYAAYEAGVRTLDGSVGGLGGSTKAILDPTGEMAGNVSTEALVEMFERMGETTGIDRPALAEASRLAQELRAWRLRSPSDAAR